MSATSGKRRGRPSSALKRLEQITTLLEQSPLVMRSEIARQVGLMFSGNRDIFTACGYPTTFRFLDFKQMYEWIGLAKRIINAYPDATWRADPDVYEDEDLENVTEFEERWGSVAKATDEKVEGLPADDRPSLLAAMHRVDIMAGIGRYAVLMLGFNDGAKLSEECKRARDLIYVQPYDEGDAQIEKLVTDVKDRRYGLPELYKIAIKDANGGNHTERVHWTRIIHVADGCLSNNVWGASRLQPVFYRMLNLEMVFGAGAESFWATGFPGTAFVAPAESTFTAESKAAMETELDEYQNGLRRFLRLKGIEPKPMPTGVANPDLMWNSLLQYVSGVTGIPVRILNGSERGELASSTDADTWDARVRERRKLFANQRILLPTIARLVKVGVLPQPKKVMVEWPEQENLSQSMQLDMAVKKIDVLSKYVGTPGADVMVSPKRFFTDFMMVEDHVADEMVEEMEQRQLEDQQQAEEDAELAAEAQAGDVGPGSPGAEGGKEGNGAGQSPFDRRGMKAHGGAGSGNFGHAGRPGEVGGSGPGGGLGWVAKAKGGDVKAVATEASKAIRSGKVKSGTKEMVEALWVVSEAKAREMHAGSKHEPRDTLDRHRGKDFKLTPERQALHDELVAQAIAGHAPSDDPTCLFLGGGPGSGKTTLVKSGLVNVPPDAVTCNPDDFKRALPDMGIAVEAGDVGASAMVHEESSLLASRLRGECAAKGYNVVVDGTGDGNEQRMREKIASMRKAGYKVEGAYTTIPIADAVARAEARATSGSDKGRFVPKSVIVQVHSSVSRVFPKVAGEFDKVSLYDMSGPKGSAPIKVATGEAGKDLTIHDEKAWDGFMGKAKGGWIL